MDIQALMQTVHLAERLKDATRHCDTSNGRRESVAEHAWRLALMADLVRDEFPDLDMDRVVRMCLWHDMGEAFTGDIPVFLKTAGDEQTERNVLFDWVSSLPEPQRGELTALFRELVERKTPEAQLCKALDGLEALIQHNEAGYDTWLPNEHDLQRDYGWNYTAFSDYLTALRQYIRDDSAEQLAAAPFRKDGLIFRRAEEKDVEAAAQIYEEVLDAQDEGKYTIGWQRGVYPTAETVRTGIAAHDFFVLERDGRIEAVGRINRRQVDVYAGIPWQYPAEDGQVSVLHTLSVRPSSNSAGLGEAFVRFYERYAAESGSPYIRIDTNYINTRARKFYKRLGYTEAGHAPCVFNGIPGVDLICLEKPPIRLSELHEGE